MADEEGLYLENLEEFINDEDRIVTYKWLSRTLSVSSNQAKQMLYSYLVKKREDKNANNISATYLVGGRCNIDDEMIQQFILTNDTNLDDTKSCFDIVTSVHVYSLQKNKPKDSNAFYTVDYNIQQEHKDDSNRWNHIYCKQATPFSDGGVNRGHLQGKSGKENSNPAGSTSIVNGQGSTKHNSNNSDKPKSSNQKSKKGQLPNMGMFAAKEEKKDVTLEKEELKTSETSKDKSNDPEKKSKSTKVSKQGGSMLSFFGKPVSGNQETHRQKEEKIKEKSPEKRKETEKTKEKPSESKDASKKLDESKKAPKETKEIQSKKKESKTTPEHKKESKKTPENKTKENKKISKQNRRRIKNLDSSDDEDEEPIPKKLTKLASDSESDSEEDIQPKKLQGKKKKDKQEESTSKKKSINKKEKVNKGTKKDENEAKSSKVDRKRKKEMSSSSSEEESKIKSKSNCTVVSETPVAAQRSSGNPVKRRKRRKVMRSKTYIDDDGFMVTEKVYESESTDASDEEPIPVKQESSPNINEAKKTSPESKSKKITEMKPAKQASLMSFFKKS